MRQHEDGQIDSGGEQAIGREEGQRIAEFRGQFERRTKSAVQFIVRAPGRINLIGDHVDYHKFPVVPMAIEKCILLGLAVGAEGGQSGSGEADEGGGGAQPGGRLWIYNSQRELYADLLANKHSFGHGASLDSSHEWFNYILCGYHGVLATHFLGLGADQVYEHAKSLRPGRSPQTDALDAEHLSNLPDMILFVDSDLPAASGLSSSSALVCAAALATRLALGRPQLDRRQLAEDCAKFEHLVGTHGGGMDQAVIMTAQRGFAKLVSFSPELSCQNVSLPEGVVWLVSHCGERYPKAATSGFNSRVLETKLAAGLIAHRCLNLAQSYWTAIDHTLTLATVHNQVARVVPQAASLQAFKRLVETEIFASQTEFTIDELAAELGLSRAELVRSFKTSEEFLERSGMAGARLPLLRRCRHVIDESERVRRFSQSCRLMGPDCARLLGRLMTESHASLRDQYECSHPALDRLVEASLEAGALGARLTGAGWGGCVVSLVESDRSGRVLAKLQKVSKFTFRTEPQSGASVMRAFGPPAQLGPPEMAHKM